MESAVAYDAMNDNVSSEPMSIRDSYKQVVKSLKQLLLAHSDWKHAHDLIAPKAPVMSLLDELDLFALHISDTPVSCAKCPLMARHMDEKIARDSIARLVRNSFSPHSVLTRDEADNLRLLFDKAYPLPPQDPVFDDRPLETPCFE